jgi:hypothetical protein
MPMLILTGSGDICVLWTHFIFSLHSQEEVDGGFDPRSGPTRDYKIGIGYFCAKHTALRRKSKDWLDGNQDNVFGWSDVSTHGLVF